MKVKEFVAKYKKTFILGIILLVFVILLVIFNILKNNSDISEAMTRGFSSTYFSFISVITKYIPISFTELFYIFFSLFIIYLFVMMIVHFVKKRVNRGIVNILTIGIMITSLLNIYTLTCEFAYKRQPVDLPYYNEKVNNDEFLDIYNYFADDLNGCINQMDFESDGRLVKKYNFEQTIKFVQEAYKILDSDYFNKVTTNPKKMISSFIYRELQITGVTFSPFGEANINYLATYEEIPFVMAHELAHTKGVMREDEANQVAFYVLLNSDSIYLRYSAYINYFSQMRSLTSSYFMKEEDRAKAITVQSVFYKDNSYIYKYWKDHDLLGKIGDFFNDLYIKMSGVKEGTSSYSGGTIPVIDESTHELVSPSKYQKLFFEKYFRFQNIS